MYNVNFYIKKSKIPGWWVLCWEYRNVRGIYVLCKSYKTAKGYKGPAVALLGGGGDLSACTPEFQMAPHGSEWIKAFG
jgi:hypothetical protein